MTSKFEGFQHDLPAKNQGLEIEKSTPDSFELLSAYLDGELSPEEKRQVQLRIDSEPEFKQLYTQLLALQGHIQHSVAPPSNKSVDEITTEVFESIDRHRRGRRQLIWGGSAIAASLVATLSGLFPGLTPLSTKIAKIDVHNAASTPVMLAVAVDRPAIDIPKSVSDYAVENSTN